MDTKKFSGFGENGPDEKSDPVAKLREIVQKKYKKEIRQDKQKGGLIPLVPIAVAALSAIAGKVAGDIYDFVKKKIQGKGYKVPHHRTNHEKKAFLLQVIRNI